MVEWIPEAVALASSVWGAIETYRRKKAAREAKEKELARQRALQEHVKRIEMTGEGIGSILDRLKDFDAAWQPIKPKASQ